MVDSPENWTTKELEDLCAKAFSKQAIIDNKELELEAEKNDLKDLNRKIQSYLDYFGKDKYVASEGSIEIRTRLSFRTPKTVAEKEAFFNWLRGKGDDVYWQYVGVNSQALNGLLKEETGPVPGIENPTEFKTIHLRRQK